MVSDSCQFCKHLFLLLRHIIDGVHIRLERSLGTEGIEGYRDEGKQQHRRSLYSLERIQQLA